MIKQVLTLFNASQFAEISLMMFASIFVAVVIRTLLTQSDVTRQQAKIVLGEQTEEQS